MTKPTMSDLMKLTTDEEIDALIICHAKHFNVVQMNPGGFVSGSRNYLHHKAYTIEEARTMAKDLHEGDEKRRHIVIYAVADIGYVTNMSRPVETYPLSKPFISKAAKAKKEREERSLERQTKRKS
jgi:hypothetical protein